MTITKTYFGEVEGAPVHLYELRNKNDLVIKLMNYGATVTSISIPEGDQGVNVVCGFDSLEEYFSKLYLENYPYFGSTIGRYANRITGGAFTADGEKFELSKNDDRNHHHGGVSGFDKKVWSAEEIQSDNDVGVKMTLVSPHLDEGYPGELKVDVSFVLNDMNEFSISFEASSDRTTPVSLTNHTYFNLSGFSEGIKSHYLKVSSIKRLEKDDQSCASTPPIDVGSKLDYGQPRMINDEEIDDYFVFSESKELRPVGSISYEQRRMEISTNAPGTQIYTSQYVSEKLQRNENEKYGPQCALCFETHEFPNGMNIKGAPNVFVTPERPYQSQTLFKFSWDE